MVCFHFLAFLTVNSVEKEAPHDPQTGGEESIHPYVQRSDAGRANRQLYDCSHLQMRSSTGCNTLRGLSPPTPTDMSPQALRNIDLNLLVPLQALLHHCHVTRAAEELCLSQSATSRALERLRRLFDDPLLVASGGTMRLTPRAEELKAQLSGVLDAVGGLLEAQEFFPEKASGEFIIAVPDAMALEWLPRLMLRLTEKAPGLTLHVRPWEVDWRSLLEAGDADLTIGQPVGTETSIFEALLSTAHWVSVVRKEHPALRRDFNLECFVEFPHLLVTTSGRGGGQVDNALAKLGLKRHVGLKLPYSALSPLIIAESNLILTTSDWLATRFADNEQLKVLETPVKLEPVKISMLWHERTHHDPRSRWFRQLLVSTVAEIRQGSPSQFRVP